MENSFSSAYLRWAFCVPATHNNCQLEAPPAEVDWSWCFVLIAHTFAWESWRTRQRRCRSFAIHRLRRLRLLWLNQIVISHWDREAINNNCKLSICIANSSPRINRPRRDKWEQKNILKYRECNSNAEGWKSNVFSFCRPTFVLVAFIKKSIFYIVNLFLIAQNRNEMKKTQMV